MATLYVGGRLFAGEKVLDGQAVLEEGGKVRKVAPTAEFTGFAGERVDTSGGTLIPGIIDCHIHSLSGAEGNPGVVQAALARGADVHAGALADGLEALEHGDRGRVVHAGVDVGGTEPVEV